MELDETLRNQINANIFSLVTGQPWLDLLGSDCVELGEERGHSRVHFVSRGRRSDAFYNSVTILRVGSVVSIAP